MIDRRTVLKSALALPAAALLGPAAGARAAELGPAWPAGAEPLYRLRVEEKEVAPFGTPIRGLLANGTWPGTPLCFTKGDLFRVMVENALPQPTTLHWHGLIVPNLEDGVPGVTQAPIGAGSALYYAFPLKQSGTYWYHSHFGLQEQQGLGGPLVIEDPDEPLVYDEDLTLFVNDVLGSPPDEVMKALKADSLEVKVAAPYVPPGAKRFDTDVPYAGLLLNGAAPDRPWTKAVRPGARLRLRLINGTGSTYLRVALDGLGMTVVAADGEAVQPLEVDNLVLATAQRYDVLVTLPESGSYTLHAAALGLDKQALAVLHTRDAEPRANAARPAFQGKALAVADLTATRDTSLPHAPDRTYEVVLSGDMKRYLWQMNGETWPEPFSAFAGDQARETYYDVSYGQVIRFDLVNRTPMVHPMHLHGHVFRVLAEGRDPATAPIRDTVSVPPNGKVSIEFLANNPGRWFFHCHNVWHLAVGMAQAVRYLV